jgi:hypothetical protein
MKKILTLTLLIIPTVLLLGYFLLLFLPALITIWLAHPFSDIPQVVRCDGGESPTPPSDNDEFVDRVYVWLCKKFEVK